MKLKTWSGSTIDLRRYRGNQRYIVGAWALGWLRFYKWKFKIEGARMAVMVIAILILVFLVGMLCGSLAARLLGD